MKLAFKDALALLVFFLCFEFFVFKGVDTAYGAIFVLGGGGGGAGGSGSSTESGAGGSLNGGFSPDFNAPNKGVKGSASGRGGKGAEGYVGVFWNRANPGSGRNSDSSASAGGNAELFNAETHYGHLTIGAGSGGQASTLNKGGDGGWAKFKASSVEIDGDVLVSSGLNGRSSNLFSGGRGGDAELDVSGVLRVLSSPETIRDLIFNKRDGNLKVHAGVLQVSMSGLDSPAVLKTFNTTADEVVFDVLKLELAALDASAAASGSYRFNGLHVVYMGRLILDRVYVPGQLKHVITLEMPSDVLPVTKAGHKPVLAVDSGISFSGFKPSNLQVKMVTTNQFKKFIYLRPGDKFKLVGGVTDGGPYDLNKGGKRAPFTIYSGLTPHKFETYFNSRESSDALLAEYLKSPAPYEQGVSYSPYFGGILASAYLITENNHMVTGNMIKDAAEAPQNGGSVNLHMSGGQLETGDGSVSSKNFNLALSLPKTTVTRLGKSAYGTFIETGTGSYDTFDNFSRLPVYGSGKAEYFGGGVFFHHLTPYGFYAETSYRGGVLRNEFKVEGDFFNDAAYEILGVYQSGHLGVGQKFNLSENSFLDIYGKALWTNVEYPTLETMAGEVVEIDEVKSKRGRLGGRYTHFYENGFLESHIGVAVEHEFNGQAGGSVGGIKVYDVPDFKGGSVIGEAGLRLKPVLNGRYALESEIFAIGGQRKGWGGTMSFTVKF